MRNFCDEIKLNFFSFLESEAENQGYISALHFRKGLRTLHHCFNQNEMDLITVYFSLSNKVELSKVRFALELTKPNKMIKNRNENNIIKLKRYLCRHMNSAHDVYLKYETKNTSKMTFEIFYQFVQDLMQIED